MSSTPWSACIRRSPPEPESAVRAARPLRGVIGVCALLALAGCSSFRSQLPLPSPVVASVGADLAVAGVLARPTSDTAGGASASPEEAAALADATGRPLVQPALDTTELRILLQPPAALAASRHALERIRQRVGHRYAAVAARDAIGLRHRTTWDVIVVLPTPWIIFFWNWPIPMSSPKTVPHDTSVVRIVDLDRAAILGESFLLRRGKARGKPFTTGQLSGALEEIGWEAP